MMGVARATIVRYGGNVKGGQRSVLPRVIDPHRASLWSTFAADPREIDGRCGERL